MKNGSPPAGEEPPRHLVAQAERQLAAYGAELDAAIETIRAGTIGEPRELVAVVASLRKALEAVFSERAKLEKIAGEGGQGGGRGGGELDLAAAGAEVRRRMARLRAAQGPRAVPAQPE